MLVWWHESRYEINYSHFFRGRDVAMNRVMVMLIMSCFFGQVRVVQYKEPPHFMAMFGGKMIVFQVRHLSLTSLGVHALGCILSLCVQKCLSSFIEQPLCYYFVGIGDCIASNNAPPPHPPKKREVWRLQAIAAWDESSFHSHDGSVDNCHIFFWQG